MQIWYSYLIQNQGFWGFESLQGHQRKKTMSKIEKKKAKLQERLNELESTLRLSLQKKTSSAAEVNVPSLTRQIAEVKSQIALL